MNPRSHDKTQKNNLIIKTFQHLRNFLAVQISFLNGLRWLNFFCSQVWFILRRLPVLLSSGHTSNDQNWRFFGSPTSVSRSLVVGDASLILLQTQVVHEFGWSHMCLHWHVLTHPSIDLSWSANGSNMAKKHDLEMIWQNNGEVMLSATTINNCQQRHVQVDGYYPPTNKV